MDSILCTLFLVYCFNPAGKIDKKAVWWNGFLDKWQWKGSAVLFSVLLPGWEISNFWNLLRMRWRSGCFLKNRDGDFSVDLRWSTLIQVKMKVWVQILELICRRFHFIELTLNITRMLHSFSICWLVIPKRTWDMTISKDYYR